MLPSDEPFSGPTETWGRRVVAVVAALVPRSGRDSARRCCRSSPTTRPADLRGFGVSARYLTLWSACAVAGGPVFGVAGYLWRRAAPAGLGAALLVAAWASEAVLVYAVRLGYTSSAVLFGGVAALLALGLAQHRDQWAGVARWSVPAVLAGAAGQALLVLVTG